MTGLEFLKLAFGKGTPRVYGPTAKIKHRREGVCDARGRKLSPMKLRCLELMGCDLEKAFPVEK